MLRWYEWPPFVLAVWLCVLLPFPGVLVILWLEDRIEARRA